MAGGDGKLEAGLEVVMDEGVHRNAVQAPSSIFRADFVKALNLACHLRMPWEPTLELRVQHHAEDVVLLFFVAFGEKAEDRRRLGMLEVRQGALAWQ